ncbi:DUF4232 domain-containing protein [Streptomyces sp. NBC_01571]|uniref:DUF4232 domain-containing protein n=1 Tax=Streptomyces sp. NBC_01571 TaxID=2975883 RepID=UPI002253A8EC|nr:DUF4232 domain-containing protein [Streptomyces sp. NBC_01571]MCX4576698.1 DUF4232 domain-containing protein [Streptomyces sp. NBC_01571]
MSARTVRTRLLAASTVALAALALTACDNGKGVRDEGPSAASRSSAQQGGSTTAKPAGDSGTSTGGSATSPTKGSAEGSANGSSGRAGNGKATGGGTGAGGTRNAACNGANTRTTATEVSRPLDHLLLTVTNTGSKNCDLTGYPIARFGEAQSVPPVAEETHPQAVVTLAPGESGYAGVLLSAGDGSGGDGYTAKTLVVGFAKGATSSPALPAKGVYVDAKLTVTYWQQSLDDALSY